MELPYDQSLVQLEENDYFSVNTLQETIDHTLEDRMVCARENTSTMSDSAPMELDIHQDPIETMYSITNDAVCQS